jgi:hypothetical protein
LRFCGIKLDPVDDASPSRTYPNAGVAHSTISAATRDASASVCTNTFATANTASRVPIASMALRDGAANPSNSAAAARSSGKVLPATAPDPSGHARIVSITAVSNRRTARANGSAAASSQNASNTGCAGCMCVVAATSVRASNSSWARNASFTAIERARLAPRKARSRAYSASVVAT